MQDNDCYLQPSEGPLFFICEDNGYTGSKNPIALLEAKPFLLRELAEAHRELAEAKAAKAAVQDSRDGGDGARARSARAYGELVDIYTAKIQRFEMAISDVNRYLMLCGVAGFGVLILILALGKM